MAEALRARLEHGASGRSASASCVHSRSAPARAPRRSACPAPHRRTSPLTRAQATQREAEPAAARLRAAQEARDDGAAAARTRRGTGARTPRTRCPSRSCRAFSLSVQAQLQRQLDEQRHLGDEAEKERQRVRDSPPRHGGGCAQRCLTAAHPRFRCRPTSLSLRCRSSSVLLAAEMEARRLEEARKAEERARAADERARHLPSPHLFA